MFEGELETYRKICDRLIGSGYEGRLVVIKGDFFAVLDTYEDAIRLGVELFGTDEPFLVKPIRADDPVEHP